MVNTLSTLEISQVQCEMLSLPVRYFSNIYSVLQNLSF
uniref:Uncharacterized protein n=1 Tax=Anguilla anguilla TaxID=7936 RepID=A0A0E9XMY5_ANGAN